MALAGQTFAALLPLLIVVSTVSPATGKDAANTIIDRLELSGDSADVVREAVARPPDAQDSIGVLSVVLLVISALSFTRALQRLYVRAWGLNKVGLRGNGWGLLWLFAFCCFWAVQPAIVGIFDGAVATAVTLVLATLLWLVTPWLLLARELPWRRLLPQACLTATGITLLSVASVLYMPRAVASASAQFGFIGVAFALLSWLFLLSLIIVVAAAVGATIGEPRRASPAATR